MSQLTDLYQELCLNCNVDKNSLFYRITKLLMEKALGIPDDVKPPVDDYINGEEFIKRFPFCALTTLEKLHQMNRDFREFCCKSIDGVITYCPYKTFKYIKEHKDYHFKLYSRLKRENYYGFIFN